MLCALAGQDPGSAREAFSQMSSDAKAAPLTQYLLFKVALRSGDQEAGEHANAPWVPSLAHPHDSCSVS